MRSNLFAYTEATPTDGYVGYVSLNKEADGSVTLTVRSPGNGGTQVGCLTLPADVRAKLGATLLRDELERLNSTGETKEPVECPWDANADVMNALHGHAYGVDWVYKSKHA